MSWKERMKEFGGGNIEFLSEDGEAIKFIVVGEPELLKGEYKGSVSRKVGCPIVTEDGLSILVAGMRLARKLAKQEEYFDSRAFMVVRHGEAGDSGSTYELKVLDEPDLFNRLKDVAMREVSEAAIAEAFVAVRDVVEK